MFRTARPILHLSPGASLASSLSRRNAPAAASKLLRRASRPVTWSVVRFASSDSNSRGKDKDKPENPPPPKQPIDREHEMKVAQEKLKPRPDEVSSQSSVRHVLEGSGQSNTPEPASLSTGLKHDIGIVRDTFRLTRVPKESHVLGLAGTIPYLATSLSTVFLAWDLTKQVPTGNRLYDALFIPHDTAHYLLSVIEPLQLGYGAVIISFLGAIHWGLEYAEKEPLRDRTRFRYGMGVAASIVAWPTLFLPFETALTTQFMAFVALYFADSRAASRGWAPQWYGMYRFLLTVMVGLAILVSLVGRASISQHGRLSSQGLSSTIESAGIADRSTNWAKLEAEEKERLRKKKEEAEKKAKKEAKKNKADKGANKEEGKKESAEAKDTKDKADKQSSGAKDDAKTDEDESKKDEKQSDDKAQDEPKEGKEKKGAENKGDSEPGKKEKNRTKDDGGDEKAKDNSKKAEDGKDAKEGDDEAKGDDKENKGGQKDKEGDKPKDGRKADKGAKK
ncbi:mitochondrial inner membrane protein 1 [Purpureocillium lilacinum]|uniref:Mitochondrial inner membrane protein 1 n=1 Tax=Purpureocillium lilacinum TaxID=33203 RepID=A0A179GU74_PURLI|nr:mitochondrial inner membrane protein 1 [Purpureocillium lilacinum]KAK4091661.1 hypothetical protein Purlil1_4091 [Purpureocillium lilacinum]OAQ80811.1 mitochondrial inner membrane protein 1 [Purpureocillium lilacinum]PWI75606.1 hypothetical protein PCL_06264 [Purpureocillium lilacinum]GJN86384.1 hypothetical protein PLIIFM63780_009964 [Purpureocillium lilacinum]